jgi:hypothetical protein
MTWHTFRHTFASRLIASGVDLVTVKELLGHSDIKIRCKITMRYAHTNQSGLVTQAASCGKIRKSRDGEVRERLNRAVSKTVEPSRVPWVRIPPSPPNHSN